MTEQQHCTEIMVVGPALTAVLVDEPLHGPSLVPAQMLIEKAFVGEEVLGRFGASYGPGAKLVA